MDAMQSSAEAVDDPKRFYDERYEQGYMQNFSGLYEACRVYTVRRILGALKRSGQLPATALDYGCGEGRYTALLSELFPDATLFGSDISEVAVGIARRRTPHARFVPMQDERVDLASESFDLIISIEVIEHVRDADLAMAETARLLKPGGTLLLTTPCANKYSLEWLVNRWRGGLQPSHDGYGRFATDEPGHLRRLNDRHLRDLTRRHGLRITRLYHRAHLFTPLVSRFAPRLKALPEAAVTQLALLDWHLLRNLPNGATVVALATKP